MNLLVLVAAAPFRQVCCSETQRGDQGGQRAHDTSPARPETTQEATFVDEHRQAECLQTDQTSPDMPCVDWPAEKAEQACLG